MSVHEALSRVPLPVQGATLRAVFALPTPLRRLIAGRPVVRDGQELALDAQLFLRMFNATGGSLTAGTPEQARQRLAASGTMLTDPHPAPVQARDVRIDGSLRGRLYAPEGLPAGSPLLVYYHGGGWVIGNLDTHDDVCRYLAWHAGVRVLSVDYRLAPEHPFPAATEDALTAFRWAVDNAESLGCDPAAVAVGGDSAGGNLAAVTCHLAGRSRGPRPVFQLLFYPGTDAVQRHRSRDLFGAGFFLTDADITRFLDNYCPDPSRRGDPLLSVLHIEDLRGFPPTYLATAGFDPLRDEGELFADRLRAAGVPVVQRRHPDLIHGYVSFLTVGKRFREATAEAAGVLRAGLTLRAGATMEDLFRRTLR